METRKTWKIKLSFQSLRGQCHQCLSVCASETPYEASMCTLQKTLRHIHANHSETLVCADVDGTVLSQQHVFSSTLC